MAFTTEGNDTPAAVHVAGDSLLVIVRRDNQ